MKYVYKKAEVPAYYGKNPERILRVWLDPSKGVSNVSCGSTEIPVGSEIPYHSHETEEEVMFIYRGIGEAEIETGEKFPLEPETVVYIPPKLKHIFRNTGDEPLCFAFFYAPPGPEQGVFKLEKMDS